MKLEMFGIFPTPVLKFNIGRDFTKQEMDFILQKENETVQPPYEIEIGNQGSISKRILENPEMAHIRYIVEQALQQWCDRIFMPLHGDKFKLKITQSWLNYTKPGQHHRPHHHPNSIVSGAIYIVADQQYDIIKFHSDTKSPYHVQPGEFNEFNSVEVNINVTKGDMVLFPSNLTHSVPETTQNYTRISLAFNAFFEGTLGISSDIPNYIEYNNVQ